MFLTLPAELGAFFQKQVHQAANDHQLVGQIVPANFSQDFHTPLQIL
jgi:hypothetical protein